MQATSTAASPPEVLDFTTVAAAIFDMDGVITDTAGIHARAWKRLFDDFLHAYSERTGKSFRPFDLVTDYRRHVDGKARLDGVRAFLDARGIVLPEGSSEDGAEGETVRNLGARKDEYFLVTLEREGAQPYPRSIEFVRALRARGIPVALISASRNAAHVLTVAGVIDLFDVRVDGVVSEELGLPGKPDPAIFLEAARRLSRDPAQIVVFEDALAGVEAGRRGGFSLVVGVDRTGHPRELEAAGAHVVVRDPADLLPTSATRPVASLPHALERVEEILGWFGRRQPVFFLDFDGTLSQIVARPEAAVIESDMREVVNGLVERFPVAILSGRDGADVQSRIGLDRLIYAGSHGFEVSGPDGLYYVHEPAVVFLPELDMLERELSSELAEIAGAIVDRKRFAIALHDRQVPEPLLPEVERIAAEAATRHPRLRSTRGRRVYEFRPDLPWDKGRALLWLLEALGLEQPRVTAIYIGDDTTDEDAFRLLRTTGVGFGVVVSSEDRESAAHYRLGDTDEVETFLGELPPLLAGRQQRGGRLS